MHGACAVRVQAIYTPPRPAKLSKGCKWRHMRIGVETYTIAYTIHLAMITRHGSPPWILDRLQHVREVFNLFDVGSSDLKKCLLSCTSKAWLTDLTK